MVRRLLLLNGLAITGVILFHASGWGFTALFAWSHRYKAFAGATFDPFGSSSYYALRIVEQLVVAVIPAFLFVSGYFVAVAVGHKRDTLGWVAVWSRTRTLLIPYLIWSGLVLLLGLIEGQTYRFRHIAKALVTGSADPAYYYVILLIQFYLVSPILVPLARRRPLAVLAGCGLVQLLVQLLQYPVLLGLDAGAIRPLVDVVPKWFFPSRIFWFSLGVVAGLQLSVFKAWVTRFRWVFPGAFLVSFVAGIFEWEYYFSVSGRQWLGHRETLIDDVYCAAFLACFVAFDWAFIPLHDKLSALGARSFGIYLVHSPVMAYAARGVYHLAPWLLVHQILLQPLLVAIGLSVPLAAMALVKRSAARRMYPYLFGN